LCKREKWLCTTSSGRTPGREPTGKGRPEVSAMAASPDHATGAIQDEALLNARSPHEEAGNNHRTVATPARG